jgi:hypothetical protein
MKRLSCRQFFEIAGAPAAAKGKTLGMPKPSFSDRFMLSISRSRCVDGLWIGSSGQKHSELVLGRVEEALGLVKTYDRVRYNRLIRDLERVLVTVLSGPAGSYNSSIGACQLDERFVLAETSSPAVIASAIVHEAAHARLQRRGVGYQEEIRARVEAICIRRQLAFAAKLPDGGQVREQAMRYLELCADRGYWTDIAFFARKLDGDVEVLHYLLPHWMVRISLVLRALNLRIRRLSATFPAPVEIDYD